jgi:hypothetical protein
MGVYRAVKGISEKTKPQAFADVAAFDFETRGLGGELLGYSFAILNERGELVDSGFFGLGDPLAISETHIADMCINRIVANPGLLWYAHNASYDWRYILPRCVERGIKLEFLLGGGQSIIQVKIADTLTRDSYSLFPQSLKKFADTYCPELPKLSIDVANFDPTNRDHREYALRDSVALAHSVHRHRAFVVEKFDVEIGVSAAGTSLKAFRVCMDSNELISGDDSLDTFFRACYFGGYVAPLKVEPLKDCRTYDINSSYPYTMRKHGYPIGAPVKLTPKNRDVMYTKPNYWRANVYCPPSVPVPVLPVRQKFGIMWPRGSFEVFCTGAELAFAESIGYKIELIEGYGFATVNCNSFTSFVDKCETLRHAHKGESVETVIKLTQNSLYGKFGTRKERHSVIHESDLDEHANSQPLELLPEYSIVREYDESVTCAPHVAAWITANARLNLFRAIYVGGAQHVAYCDTDSMTVTPGFDASKINVGKEYGQFKYEKTWRQFRAVAPKVYAGVLDTGAWYGACKGVPKPTADQYAALYRGEQIEADYLSLPGACVYMKRGGAREAVAVTRKSTNPANVSGWNISAGKSTPKTLK